MRESQRVVGLYKDGAQVGFARAFTDDMSAVYLADVYVLEEHRGRGLGIELVREMVDNGPLRAPALDAAHARHAPAVREARLRPAERARDGARAYEAAVNGRKRSEPRSHTGVGG